MMAALVVAALYKFVPLKDIETLQATLKALCSGLHMKGILLLAPEGINGTVVGTRSAIDQLNVFFQQDPRFDGLEYKESFAQAMPFRSLRVRLKKEIVTLGVGRVDPIRQRGTYVAPENWNALLEDPDIVLLDVRNKFEVAIGTFKNALNPQTTSFRDFPQYVKQNLDPKIHEKVAMVCTGGIRCEKASAYMKQAGFKNVYYLKGGILKYLETVPAAESQWEGACFVFDQRVALAEGLKEGEHQLCYSCQIPLSVLDRQSPHYQPGISCAKCHDVLTPKQKQRRQERQHQATLAKARMNS